MFLVELLDYGYTHNSYVKEETRIHNILSARNVVLEVKLL